MDLMALLSGAAGAAGGSSDGGLAGMLSAAGSASPLPFGGLIGSALGGITGIFGNHPAPGHELPDQDAIAAGAGVTREQAGWVCADEADRGSANFDDVCKKYAHDIPGFLARVPIYNSTHPQSIVRPTDYSSQYPSGQIGVKVPTEADIWAAMYQQGLALGTPKAAVATIGTSTSGLGSSLTAADIKNILGGAKDGAIAGATSAAMDTKDGQDAQWAAIKAKAVEYQSFILLGLGGIGFLGWKAYKNN